MEAIKVNGIGLVRGAILPLIVAFIPSAVLADAYALWFDCSHTTWSDFVIELLFPPLGVFHGLVLLFGN